MGIFTAMANSAKRMERRTASPIPDFLTGGALRNGVTVNEQSALSLSPVWSICDRLAGITGVFPLKTYRNEADGTIALIEHPALKLLNKDPNDWQTGYELKYTLMSNMLLHGCGAAEIVYKSGFPSAILPVHPTNIQVVNTNGKITYKVRKDNGTQVVMQGHQLLLFKLFPKCDGTWYSPLQTHREIFAEALTLREFSATVFSQGFNPAGIVSGTPENLTEEALETLKKRFQEYAGLGKQHQLMILAGNEKFDRVAAPSTDLQYIETRRFQISEFARLYNLPLHLLAEQEKSSSWGSGLEAQNLHYVQFILSRFLHNWEGELNKKLFSVDDDSVYCKFVVDGLLRGNTKERMEAYQVAASLGLYSINELRAMEERNPLGDLGEARLVPLNYQNLKNAVEGKEQENG